MSNVFKYAICGFIITLTAIIFGFISLNKKVNFKKPRLYIGIALSTILYVLFNYIEIGELKSILNSLMISLLIWCSVDINITKAIFMSFIHSILLLISEVICFTVLIYILKLDNSYIYNVFAGSILSNIMVFAGFIINLLIMKKPLRKLFNYKMSSNKQIALFTTLTAICVFALFYLGFSNLKLDNALLVSLFGMIVFLIILFGLIKQKIENNKIMEKYDSLMEFMKSYEEVIDEQRIQHHENKNQLINIRSKLVDKDKNKSIINYIDSILDEKLEFNKEKYSKLKNLPSNGLKGLFYYKISKAEEQGIKVSINISEGIDKSILYKINTNDYKQLCRIIGVYLDNAIEASFESLDKLLGIEIYNDTNEVNIIISNSYQKIDLSKVNKKGYSTKGKGRGYGLSLVNYILTTNKKFETQTEANNNIYMQRLTIKEK